MRILIRALLKQGEMPAWARRRKPTEGLLWVWLKKLRRKVMGKHRTNIER